MYMQFLNKSNDNTNWLGHHLWIRSITKHLSRVTVIFVWASRHRLLDQFPHHISVSVSMQPITSTLFPTQSPSASPARVNYRWVYCAYGWCHLSLTTVNSLKRQSWYKHRCGIPKRRQSTAIHHGLKKFDMVVITLQIACCVFRACSSRWRLIYIYIYFVCSGLLGHNWIFCIIFFESSLKLYFR